LARVGAGHLQLQGAPSGLGVITSYIDLPWIGIQSSAVDHDIANAQRLSAMHRQYSGFQHRATAVGVCTYFMEIISRDR
jgi:hypothetical protein